VYYNLARKMEDLTIIEIKELYFSLDFLHTENLGTDELYTRVDNR